ncbi:MAG: alpha/beta fold hydrolase [Neorhizobium sp.]|jgi:type IV secretory pathway VirJ component|nr:alpha/beta fold hydrolase [Neorhizobium sp.]
MSLLPIIVAVITAAATFFNFCTGPSFKTSSLPTSHIVYPSGDPKSVVVLLSDANGWNEDEEEASETLREDGAVVVGVDLPEYYAALGNEKRDCLYLVSDIEDLSRQVHRFAGLSDYRPPVIAGLGDGATLALAIAAQTPESTISETLAIDPESTIPLSTVLCTPAPKKPGRGGIVYGLTAGQLPNPIRVVLSPKADAEGRAHTEDLKVSHPDIKVSHSGMAADDALRLYGAELLDRLARSKTALNLPIVPIPAEPKHDTMAIVYSGDGGWRDIDEKLGSYLQEEGIPVVGVDSLRYFWSEKSPQKAAEDLSRIIDTYRRQWKVDHVILIGYSFGANILPATYDKLPDADRQVVSLVSLLAPTHQADFKIAVTGWLGVPGAGKYGDPVAALAGMEPWKIQCIHGRDEEGSACLDVEKIAGTQVLERPGSHHFDGDYRALNRLIVDRMTALSATN